MRSSFICKSGFNHDSMESIGSIGRAGARDPFATPCGLTPFMIQRRLAPILCLQVLSSHLLMLS